MKKTPKLLQTTEQWLKKLVSISFSCLEDPAQDLRIQVAEDF